MGVRYTTRGASEVQARGSICHDRGLDAWGGDSTCGTDGDDGDGQGSRFRLRA